jgi:flagellar biosynthesis protein FliQ
MVVAVVTMATGPWMLRQITGFTTRLVENLPYLIG